MYNPYCRREYFLVVARRAFRTALGSSAKINIKSFREMAVLDLRQIFVKNLIVFMFKISYCLFKPCYVTHAHNTIFSLMCNSFSIMTHRVTKAFTCTNSYYLAHIVYNNVANGLKDFRTFELPIKIVLLNG